MNDKTFEIGELCLIPYVAKNGMSHAIGIIVKRNPLKLRSNFYSVYYNGRIYQHENLFIAKIEEMENESLDTY
jgi:hypothetical protein